MSQSKRHSAVETATNTAVGFFGSYLITYGCFHLTPDLATATLYATLGCTAWSLVRGYYLRRLFNHLHTKQGPVVWPGLDDLQSRDRTPLGICCPRCHDERWVVVLASNVREDEERHPCPLCNTALHEAVREHR